jgi:O-antigen/teichoic acid export membrane protein
MFMQFRQFLAKRHNVRAHFWQSLANYTQAGGGMLLGIVLARLLEPAVFGEFVFITASLGFLMIPVSFSTAQLLISDAGKTPGLFKRVWGLATLVSVIKLILVTCFVLYWLYRGEHTRAHIATLVGIPAVFSDYLVALRYDLEGRGQFKPNFFAQAIDISLQACISIILVLNGYGIYGLAWGGVLGFVIQFYYYTALCGRRISLVILSPHLLFRQMRSGFWLWLGTLASGWFLRVDKILLGAYGGPTQLGLYNRAMNYGPISHILLNSLMTNASVRAFSITEDFGAKRRLFFRTLSILLLAAVTNGLFWMVAADKVIPFLFGNQWLPAAPSFAALGWLGVPFSLLYGSVSVLYSQQQFKTIAILHLSGLLLLAAALGVNVILYVPTSYSTALIVLGSMLTTGLAMFAASLSSLSRSP